MSMGADCRHAEIAAEMENVLSAGGLRFDEAVSRARPMPKIHHHRPVVLEWGGGSGRRIS